jgi:hypothetical protein
MPTRRMPPFLILALPGAEVTGEQCPVSRLLPGSWRSTPAWPDGRVGPLALSPRLCRRVSNQSLITGAMPYHGAGLSLRDN